MSSNGDDTNDKTCPSKGEFDCWGVRLNATLEANDIQATSFIKVYPNPTSDFITIEIADTEQIQAIELLELSGKSIKTLEPNSKTFSLTDLKTGIYLLQITTEKGNFCEQIRLE